MFTRRVFRLLALDHYKAANEHEPYRAFLAGEPADLSWRQPWMGLVRGVRESRREMARVHVVTEPVSEYVRFSLLRGYPSNVAAGEDVRIIGRGLADAKLLPNMDFWLFDDGLAAVLEYDSDGNVEQVVLDQESAHLADYRRWREIALMGSTPLAEYVAEHGITEERTT